MKLICISNKFRNHIMPPLIVGEVYTSFGRSEHYPDGYYLEEIPFTAIGSKASYHEKHFIPLSDIDETELLKQREENLIPVQW